MSQLRTILANTFVKFVRKSFSLVSGSIVALSVLISLCEHAMYPIFSKFFCKYINIKFGGPFNIEGHPHLVSFIQGTKYHGNYRVCTD